MNSATDQELLRAYAETKSEDAFAELVGRHVDFVYSAAVRMIRDQELARDVTQAVFVALSRSASALQARPRLLGWLHRTAQNVAANIIRTEERRKLREQEMAETMHPHPLSAQNDEIWNAVAPCLDRALEELSESERDAVLLRYFSRKPAKEIADELGITPEAAQKRVNRAVDHLRELLAKQGVAVGTSGLAAAILANAVQAAPVGLTSAIACSSAIASTLSTATATAAIKTMAMTTAQKILIGATLSIAAAAGVYQTYQAGQLRERIVSLERLNSEKERQFGIEREDLSTQVAALVAEDARSRSNIAEIARLRGEISSLRTAQLSSARQLAAGPVAVQDNPTDAVEVDQPSLPRSSWADIGFTTPRDALRTRGWCVLTGNRERFKYSIFITDEARKTLEDTFVKMAEASKDPDKGRYIQDVIANNLGVEEGFLMPMMAEHQRKEFTGYRILSQDSPSPNEMLMEVETTLASEPPKKERLKFRRFGQDWKVVIDTEFLGLARR